MANSGSENRLGTLRHVTLTLLCLLPNALSLQVLITCLIGAAFKEFHIFSGLVGSFMLSIVGFIVPPLLYWRLNKKTMSFSLKVFVAFSVVLGFVVMIVGTYASIYNIFIKK